MLALWIILGVIAFMILLSLMPFSFRVNGVRDEEFSYQTAFHWPWRTFGIGTRRDSEGRYVQFLCGSKCLYQRPKRKKKEKVEKKKGKERKKKKKGKADFSFVRDRELLSQLIKSGLKLVKKLLLCLRRPRLAGDVEIGFGDPAAMGIISGFVYTVSRKGMVLDELRIRPNYVDATFTGEVDFSTGARPGRIIAVLIGALFYIPIRGLFRLFRSRKKTAKNKEVSENGS